MWREVKENEVHCKQNEEKNLQGVEMPAFLHCFSADVVDALPLKEGSKEKGEENVH